jgi:hypothetical protein
MFQQQNIVVSKPHMKPEILKPSLIADPPEEITTVMPLEDFAEYELELQETILQLNSELVETQGLGGEGSTHDPGGLSEADSDDEEDDAILQSSEDGIQNSVPAEGSSASSHEDVVVPADDSVVKFDAYELLLQRAVHELASLSDILVG